MKKMMITFAALSIVMVAAAQVKPKTATAKPAEKANIGTGSAIVLKNSLDSFSYAIGLNVGSSMQKAGITEMNPQLAAKGINDILKNDKPALTQEEANAILQKRMQELQEKKAAVEKGEGKMFLEANSKRSGVTTLPDGLQYEIITAGEANGAKPRAIDTVVVDYIGTLSNGTEFDNSIKRGKPATFPLGNVIRGWTEVLQLMPKGAHWKVYIPSELGYGENPPPGAPIPPNAVLVFDITLKDIKATTPPADH